MPTGSRTVRPKKVPLDSSPLYDFFKLKVSPVANPSRAFCSIKIRYYDNFLPDRFLPDSYNFDMNMDIYISNKKLKSYLI